MTAFLICVVMPVIFIYIPAMWLWVKWEERRGN